MDYLGALRMFVRAVEVGSFSKAAIATNTKTSTVSRAIASLEEHLGVSLFHRTTRRAHLTEPGATFYQHARGVLRGPGGSAGCGLGNGGAATGIDPSACPELLRPFAAQASIALEITRRERQYREAQMALAHASREFFRI
jgi:DNA-binding transcriptional LysR family regulator